MLSDKRETSVPLEMSRNRLLIPVRVNNNARLRLILDTGMPMEGAILFDSPEVRKLGLENGSEERAMGMFEHEGEKITLDVVSDETTKKVSLTLRRLI